jgi:hypothetical protein
MTPHDLHTMAIAHAIVEKRPYTLLSFSTGVLTIHGKTQGRPICYNGSSLPRYPKL